MDAGIGRSIAMEGRGGKMIVIIADEGEKQVGKQLYGMLLSSGAQAEYIPLDNVRVQPCFNCGACTKKTPGRCVARDDGDWIYPKVADADAVVVVTPVVYGGYSVKAKRVIDKFGIFMDSHYFIRNGELVKGGLRGRQFKYFAVGTGALTDDEAEVFETLIHETIVITRGAGRAFLAGAAPDERMLKKIAAEVIGA